MRTSASALISLAVAVASVFPAQPLYDCVWTGARRQAVCCCKPHAAKRVRCASCESAGRTIIPRRGARRDSPGAPTLVAIEGACCSVTYDARPRIASSLEASRKLWEHLDPAAAACLEAFALPAEPRACAGPSARAGPAIPGGPPLFLLHRALLL